MTPYKLTNHTKTLILTSDTWYGLLDLAVDHGWNPIAPLFENERTGWVAIPPVGTFGWLPENPERPGMQIILEDALNLADALERAFMEREPQLVPTSYYLFEPAGSQASEKPSIGALTELIDLSSRGSFWVEEFNRNNY